MLLVCTDAELSQSPFILFQVLCSVMVVREDADIGSVVVGDIHKKSKCAQLRLLDAIEILSELRKTQLDVLHCGLGLQDVTDDIADDVGVTRALFGEYPDSVQVCGKDAAKGFVAEVQDAMKLEGPECVEPPQGNDTDAPDSSTTVSQKDIPPTPLKSISCTPPLSPDGLLCTMHSKSPCTPTGLNARSTPGPWFQRTPTLCLPSPTPAVSVKRSLELEPIPTVQGDNSLCSTEIAVTGNVSCVSATFEGLGEKRGKGKVSSTPVDNSQDDVISRTSLKCDGM